MSIYYYIYQVTNKLNGNIYVGVRKSKILPDDDTRYMGSGFAIKAAILNYGLANFEKTILSLHNSWSEALAEEACIVDSTFVLREDTYNLTLGGFGGSIKGRTFSDSTRAKMSEAKKGTIPWNKGKPSPLKGKSGTLHSIKSKHKISKSLKGKPKPPRTEVHKKNLSIANTGKIPSEETRQKISIANKGKPSPHKGKTRPPQTAESNKKRSEALLGRKISDEHRKKISDSNTGRPSYNKGKPMSEEQKRKISETLRRKALEKSLLLK